MKKPRWALFISGQGTNMSALLDEKWDLDVALVISSSRQSAGALRAKRSGIPVMFLEKKINWQLVLENLKQRKVTHIFLVGFMKIVPLDFLKQWAGCVLNVHPSLLPAYQGLKSIERAYQQGSDIGVTVHHVNAEVDSGEIVLQKKVIPSERVQKISLLEAKQKVHWTEYQLVRKAVERKYA